MTPRGDATGAMRPYQRELPGGGFAAIDVHAVRDAWWKPVHYVGELVVERRAVVRRDDTAPIIARGTGATVEDVVALLLPAAQCNETIGAALLRLHPIAAKPASVTRASTVSEPHYAYHH